MHSCTKMARSKMKDSQPRNERVSYQIINIIHYSLVKYVEYKLLISNSVVDCDQVKLTTDFP
uniref:Uncharacterized protein n=1 Tax=Oryza sativa subsp. japonica TaxID=39947 RepID=Q69XF9_ORYSJ|nr:hypothetical protein [Oryza sativa Japonica Group]